jgi:hypothetical protein
VSGTELLFSHNAWFAGITHDYVAGAFKVASLGNAYASITSLNSGDIDVRTVDQPLGTGERFNASDLAISLGFGRQMSTRFSAGIQVNFLQETIWHSSASTMTLSLGTLYRVSENGLRVGSSLSNFGTRAAYDGRDLRFTYDNVPGQNGDNSALPGVRATSQFAVPLVFRVGVAMPFRLQANNRLMLAADAFHPNDNSESVSVGAEYLMNDLFAVRAGYQNLLLKDTEVGTTLGAGLKGQLDTYRYRVDYAWADQGRLGHSNRVSVALAF